MADREVNRCNRICSMNDPDKGCLLGGVESCRIGSEQVMQRVRCDFPFGQRPPIDALLIDANVVLAAIDKVFYETNPRGEEQIGVLKCRRIVRTAPTVDAVEVVRCKDCVYYKPGKHFKDVNFCQRLPYYAEKGGLNVSDEDFCSHGERRSAENSRDLSGYADKLREIKEEKAKKSVEKAKKSVETALEKLEKVGL